ncbi:hypothetical protein Tco_0756882, partial [Tanacetum coccineum]
MSTPYRQSDNNVLNAENKRLDNVQTVNTSYPLRLDISYRNKVFKLDLSLTLHSALVTNYPLSMIREIPCQETPGDLTTEDCLSPKVKMFLILVIGVLNDSPQLVSELVALRNFAKKTWIKTPHIVAASKVPMLKP